MLAFRESVGNGSHEHKLYLAQISIFIELWCHAQLLKELFEMLRKLKLVFIFDNF
jgi:hypothetical protein